MSAMHSCRFYHADLVHFTRYHSVEFHAATTLSPVIRPDSFNRKVLCET